MQKLTLESIGTHLTIEIDTQKSCEKDFHTITERLSHFEQKFSRFREDNWLRELNTSKHAILDDDARKMLSFALSLAEKTHGYFDPTIGKQLSRLGYGRTTDAQENNGNFHDVKIHDHEVFLQNGVELEFGGVGKGYLLDVISSLLDHYDRFLINFGGDIYARGDWNVGLESPMNANEIIGTLLLRDSFLACSAGTKRKWGNHHHLIDPHTGESARDVIASYIEGNTGICVDSYATVLCVMPWELAMKTLEETKEIEGVLIRHDGTLFRSGGSRSEVFTAG